MANLYKTVRGKTIDMSKLKLSNENAVAVGNMKVNARGDLLGSGNQVIASRNQLMDQTYAVADSGYIPEHPPIMEASNAQQLNDLINNAVVPVTPSDDSAQSPAARGSLADSIAKQTTVTQEPLPLPSQQKKSNGPSRF